MAQAPTQNRPQAASQEGTPRRISDRLMYANQGWQVADINQLKETEKSAFVALTEMDESAVILNCYQPGQHDEMHAHPKEEHVFLVWQGKLHLTGVEDGEEITLEAGQFAHIDNGYYYRLHNPGPEPAVYVQFRTLPARPPKRRIVFFAESARGKKLLAEQKARQAGTGS
jgi:mannose-6-phosphate isomerase-like protein (cupin superfamily)